MLAARLGGKADALDEPGPAVLVGGLERIVVALDPGQITKLAPMLPAKLAAATVRRWASARTSGWAS